MKKPNKLKSILQTTNSRQINRQIEANSKSFGSFWQEFGQKLVKICSIFEILKSLKSFVKCLRDLEQITIKMKEG